MLRETGKIMICFGNDGKSENFRISKQSEWSKALSTPNQCEKKVKFGGKEEDHKTVTFSYYEYESTNN